MEVVGYTPGSTFLINRWLENSPHNLMVYYIFTIFARKDGDFPAKEVVRLSFVFFCTPRSRCCQKKSKRNWKPSSKHHFFRHKLAVGVLRRVHTRKLTWNLKITPLKTNIILQAFIFWFYVSFREGTSYFQKCLGCRDGCSWLGKRDDPLC